MNKVIVIGGGNLTPLQVCRSAWLGTGTQVIFLQVCPQEPGILGNAICVSKSISTTIHFKSDREAIDYLASHFQDEIEKPIVFTASDSSAEMLDQNYEDLSKKYFLCNCCGRSGEIITVNTKEKQIELARACGFIVPKTITLDKDFDINLSVVPFPCILKPLRSSCGGKDIEVCKTSEEFVLALNHYKEKNVPIQIQEYIEKEYEICLVGSASFINERITIPGVIKKIRESCKCTSFCQLVPTQKKYEKVTEQVRNIVRACNYHGIFSAEILIKEGCFYFLEMNFRADANILAYTEAGHNLIGELCSEIQRTNYHVVSPVHTIYGMDERTDSWNVRQGQCSWMRWLWQYFMTDCKYLAYYKDRSVFWDWLRRKIGWKH